MSDQPHLFGRSWNRLVWLRRRMRRHQTGLLSAGVAFYVFLGLFPALGAAVSIYGLLAGAPPPADVAATAPATSSVRSAMSEYRRRLTRQPRRTLGAGAAAGILLALWSASKGAGGLLKALDEAYEVPDRRRYLAAKGTALLLTLAGVVMLVLGALVVAAAPRLLHGLGVSSSAAQVLAIVRWPILALALPAGLALVYRYGPCHPKPRPGWLSAGALVATALWALGSCGLTLYLNTLAKLDRTYGGLTAAVVLLIWLHLAAFAVLVGAEINAGARQSGSGSR